MEDQSPEPQGFNCYLESTLVKRITTPIKNTQFCCYWNTSDVTIVQDMSPCQQFNTWQLNNQWLSLAISVCDTVHYRYLGMVTMGIQNGPQIMPEVTLSRELVDWLVIVIFLTKLMRQSVVFWNLNFQRASSLRKRFRYLFWHHAFVTSLVPKRYHGSAFSSWGYAAMSLEMIPNQMYKSH